MTSYFEIAGEIIESTVVQIPFQSSPQSFKSLAPLLERETKKLQKSISAGPKSSQSGDGRGSLLRHWVRSITYPTERLLEEPGVLISPKGLGTFGIKTYTELIGKHYDYFIKGEDPWINYQ
ncbi:hypothetical protein N9J16_01225 [Candidatus Poseidoniaceae archaeon]|nr:hypothetical protein [Candidatus Poseidoniaceae archaeon]